MEFKRLTHIPSMSAPVCYVKPVVKVSIKKPGTAANAKRRPFCSRSYLFRRTLFRPSATSYSRVLPPLSLSLSQGPFVHVASLCAALLSKFMVALFGGTYMVSELPRHTDVCGTHNAACARTLLHERHSQTHTHTAASTQS